MIDVMEVWDIATSDIRGSFLQTDNKKGDIHIKIEVEIMNIIEETNSAYYKDFIFIDS